MAVDAELRERMADKRSTPASRARLRAQIAAEEGAIGAILRDLPIRPSMVDDVVAELRDLDRQYERTEKKVLFASQSPAMITAAHAAFTEWFNEHNNKG